MIEAPKISDPSLVYMYGLSDFWTEMFGDSKLVEAVLASSTIELGEVYSYFLQRAAGISLSDIKERYNTRIQLLLLSEDDALDAEMTHFRLGSSITSTDKISNRPILPTQTLDGGVHYEIMDGTIRFYTSLKNMKFPARHTSAGKLEYALWMVDVEIDERWIDNSFGKLVGFTEDDAIFNYKSFLEGVYFLYTNGPNISHIERGVNLAMGMPYARDTEIVLDITQDAVTGNWVVFTDTQAYEMPYGYNPELSVGDTLLENSVLSNWVEIRDYVRNGDWWYDIFLPKEVLGTSTPSEVGRCVAGSTGDTMMKNFLKHHMFEVLITQPNGDEHSFATARNLVLYAKPEYTYPVFVWKVPLPDELIDIRDDFKMNLNIHVTETCVSPPSIRFMDRSTDDDLFTRGIPWYNRYQSSMYMAGLLGYGDWPGNAGWSPEFASIDDRYLSAMNVLMRTRGDKVLPVNRDTVTRGWRGVQKGVTNSGEELAHKSLGMIWNIPGNKVLPAQAADYTFNERLIQPLYMIGLPELIAKVRTLYPRFTVSSKDFRFVISGLNLPSIYNSLITPGTATTPVAGNSKYDFVMTDYGLDVAFSIFANQAYVPKLSEMYNSDGTPITNGTLLISKNHKSTWSVSWIRNKVTNGPTIFPVEDQDHLKAIEDYSSDTVGSLVPLYDRYISAGQRSINSPIVLGSKGTAVVTVGGFHLPSVEYDVTTDGSVIELVANASDTGFVSWFKYSGAEIVVPADGDTYFIPVEVLDREGILLSYSPTSDNYEFIMDYTIAPDIMGTQVILGSPLPPGGDLVVTLVDHSTAPVEDRFVNSGTTYTVESGYTLKIFSDNKLLQDSKYYLTGTTLTFYEAPTSPFIVRYYALESVELLAPFNRSTVARNEATFLMDRRRPDGRYDSRWEGLDGEGVPVVYMNRGGFAWDAVPQSGTPPSRAGNIYVTRRLR